MKRRKTAELMKTHRTIRPERVMALGFLPVIALGTLLLALPAASQSGQSIGVFNALFTATSAVCVTGLVTVDTGTTFSALGQGVLLLLIQTGGLGFMILATMVFMALGRKFTLRDRMLIKEATSADSLSGLLRVTRSYTFLTLQVELIGAVLLATRFVPRFGLGKGIWFSVFHAVSAFCNAGFDLFGDFSSLTHWCNDPVVILTISVLIILGGLGFSVVFEALRDIRHAQRLSLHAKVALVMSGALLMLGTAFYALVEWNNPGTLASTAISGAGSKVMNAFFQSVTMRTAGFNSVPLDRLREGSKLFSVVLMFIGASPASTGGGLKTTTFGAVLLITLSVVRGQKDVNVMGRRLPTDLLRRALAIMTIFMAFLFVGILAIVLSEREGKGTVDLIFEATSALATVGVSAAGTPKLTLASKAVLLPMMYFGRIGPMTLALALAKRKGNANQHIRYPEENLMIG